MVRGNWQRRVERTIERRNEAKQRKQRSEEKKVFKQSAQELLALMEKHSDEILRRCRQNQRQRGSKNANTKNDSKGGGGDGISKNNRSWMVHIWTDCIPSDAPPILDMHRGMAFGNSSSGASRNYEDMESDNKQKSKRNGGRGRSNSINEKNNSNNSNGKKKVHPRSKEMMESNNNNGSKNNGNDDDMTPTLCLCRSHFFMGKCDNFTSNSKKGKKGGGGGGTDSSCPFVHYPKRTMTTLADALLLGGGGSERTANSSPHQQKSFNNSLSFFLMDGPASSSSSPKDVLSMTEQAFPIFDATTATAAATTTTMTTASTSATTSASTEAMQYGAMDMVYHFMIDLNRTERNEHEGKEEEESSGAEPASATTFLSVNQLISQSLSKRDCGMASIVYVVMNNVLIYDRYRDGVLLSDRGFLVDVVGVEHLRSRAISTASSTGADGGGDMVDGHASATMIEDRRAVFFLPGSILEHVMTFLPDSSVAVSCLVCQAWNREIGKVSMFLWRHLLERRRWPLPPQDDSSTVLGISDQSDPIAKAKTEMTIYRQAFVSSYMVLRDIKAVARGVSTLLNVKRGVTSTDGERISGNAGNDNVPDGEFFVHPYSSRKGAPQEPNVCVALEVWSENRSLLAYSEDCSLRLFSAIPKSASGSSEKHCREINCQFIDPYRNTKKRNCQLVAMGLDEETIGCLLHVFEDPNNNNNNHHHNNDGAGGEAFVIALLSREDYLVGEDLDDAMQVIDVCNAVLNFMLSCDVVDYELLRLHDFINDGGDLDDIEVFVSESISACGYGRFMVEVSVSIPPRRDESDDDDDVSTASMDMLFRKLFVFSSSIGAIVWMGESNYADAVRPREEDMVVTCTRLGDSSLGRTTCNLVTASTAAEIMTVNIDESGQISCPSFMESSVIVRNEMGQRDGDDNNDDWNHSQQKRSVVITTREVILADTFYKEIGPGGQKIFESFVSFLPLHQHRQEQQQQQQQDGNDNENATGPLYTILKLNGNIIIDRLVQFRDDHVVAICRDKERIEGDENDHIPELRHWGGQQNHHQNNDHRRRKNTSIVAIIVDVRTREEIDRVSLVEDIESSMDVDPARLRSNPISLSAVGGTVSAAISCKGVVMTGTNVRGHVDGTTTMQQNFFNNGMDVSSATSPTNNSSNNKNSSSKKKKKKTPKKGGKKDGFARGMSMRG